MVIYDSYPSSRENKKYIFHLLGSSSEIYVSKFKCFFSISDQKNIWLFDEVGHWKYLPSQIFYLNVIYKIYVDTTKREMGLGLCMWPLYSNDAQYYHNENDM